MRADIDGIGRIPNAPPAVEGLLLWVPIGVLTVRASRARSGSGGRNSASADEHLIDQRRVGEHTRSRVESLAAPRVAEHAAGLARRSGSVAAKSQSDPNVRIAASSSPAATITASSTKL